MNYVPLDSLDLIDLYDLPATEELMLFTSEHDGAQLLVLQGSAVFLDGAYRGEVMQARAPGDWTGSVVRRLQIEVDPTSVVYERPVPSALSIERVGSAISLSVVDKEPTFARRVTLPLRSALNEAPINVSAHYTRWRLIAEVRGDAIELLTIAA